MYRSLRTAICAAAIATLAGCASDGGLEPQSKIANPGGLAADNALRGVPVASGVARAGLVYVLRLRAGRRVSARAEGQCRHSDTN
jgi:hypothetical protein